MREHYTIKIKAHPLTLILDKLQTLTGIDTKIQIVSTPHVTVAEPTPISLHKYSELPTEISEISNKIIELTYIRDIVSINELVEVEGPLYNQTIEKLFLKKFLNDYPHYLKEITTQINTDNITLFTTLPNITLSDISYSIYCDFYTKLVVPNYSRDSILQNCKRSGCPNILKCTLGVTRGDCILSYLL